jgi:putative DNA primase/helicase
MSWGDESWHEAARDYHADRKLGRRHRIVNMDSERDVTDAAIISFGEHRDQLKEIRPPAFSDDALALRFIDQHKDTLRYVPSLGKWLRWDDKRWCFDDRLIAYDRMRRVCRAAAAECNQPKLAKLIASNKTAAAAERFARSDQRIIATVDELDADPWLLNTPRGTVDLRTGEERSHNQSDLLTKITGVAPDASCPTPVWDAFLARVTDNQPELSAYLQRMAGYSLTGSTQEHALFFLYGLGANGKTTFLNVITACAGDYHRTAPIETFTASSVDRHPTELAGLRGARLVTAIETEEGRRWAESRIKSLTGGDKISARFMRQDFFEYTPQFKLIIAGNHKPGLKSVDEAIRRRFNLIPFTVTIPPEERDEALPEKLKAELPGIMQWMIEAAWIGRSAVCRPPKWSRRPPQPTSKLKTPSPLGLKNSGSEIQTPGRNRATSSPPGRRGPRRLVNMSGQ